MQPTPDKKKKSSIDEGKYPGIQVDMSHAAGDATPDEATAGMEELSPQEEASISQLSLELVQQLQAITGLPPPAAKDLLSGVQGNLKAAVDLFFGQDMASATSADATRAPLLDDLDQRVPFVPVEPHSLRLPPRSLGMRCRGVAEFVIQQVSRFVSLAFSSLWILISGLVRPIGTQSFGINFDAAFRRLIFTADDGTIIPNTLTFPSTSLVQVMPVACSQLKPIFAFVMNSAALGSDDCSDLRHLCSRVLSMDVQQSLNEDTCLLGFDPKSSLTNRLHCRFLQLDPNAPLSIAILLPFVLSPQLVTQFRRMMNPNDTIGDMTAYHSLPNEFSSVGDSHFSRAQVENAFMAVQAKFVVLAEGDQLPAVGEFKLNILRNGCIECYTLSLAPHCAADPSLLKSSILQAIQAATALIEPLRDMKNAEQERREADRRLIQEQQREYEESLAADRARAQQKREEERRRKVELDALELKRQIVEEQEEKRMNELKTKAQHMLSAVPIKDPNEVFADILLRMGSRNERLRLRVHKDLKFKSLLEVVDCVDFMIEASDRLLWVRPAESATGGVACQVEVLGTGIDRPVPSIPPAGYQVTTAIAGIKLDPEKSVAECQLLPNAVLHVRAA
eukprot:Gregarina_sp_Poly_1__4525@NODE_242_length_10830_cov_108_673047_g213_i0_p3_GENE_NODE_242_length_10830_cov_108_673047_g213_i0NODE_242_length_10830_cov_108_673047_g213_i0_p3_ORF_typecomplete_len620_score103_11UBA_4/PF14555_6/1_6e08SMC_N/PF02463_19/8_3e05UBX/PF00789_20/5_9e03UBX/PF00789_20/0_028GBP_C/PF02841_14/0_021TAP_C/PF03943_13/0_4Pinin_SDK_memA/PF04696_13/0_51DUF572/PF04502_13/2_4Borrelia_P83/PF05262_11/4_9VPS38/PF17649_1/5_3e02VPS38/PF17649_1/69DDRGK/PF09756_9/14_NODE_242_length_10830_cov_108